MLAAAAIDESERTSSQGATKRGVCAGRWLRWALRGVLSLLLVATLLPVNAAPVSINPGYADVVRRVAPSVVTVLAERQRESPGQRAAERATADANGDVLREVMRRLFLPPSGSPGIVDGGSMLGSGFVIRADGLIVTNRHVIAGARRVSVKLSDGREVPARIVGADAATDIALLKVQAGHLPSLLLRTSESVAVGDPVIAIGNPFGLGQSVTAGIVSARGRTLEDDPYIDFLQTDAAINAGNSGGPLLSLDGAVVGVTSAIISPSGGSVGLGLAIPAATVASIVAELEAHGRVQRGYIGILAQPMTAALGRALGTASAAGALVTGLDPQGPAVWVLEIGDVLIRLGSTPVKFNELGKVAARIVPGTTVDAVVLRDGVERTMSVTIAQLPDPEPELAATGGSDTWVPALELGVATTTMEIRKAISADREPGGFIVTQLRPIGPGSLAGLKVGDLITHLGSRRLTELTELSQVRKPSQKAPMLLRVVREGRAQFIAIPGADA